jgi:mannuronan 5-epimerase
LVLLSPDGLTLHATSSASQFAPSLSSSSPPPPLSNCATYDSELKIIHFACKSGTLTDIDNQISNPDILNKDNENDGIWLLNAGINIVHNATLFINSTDTSWLRIAADGNTAHPINVFGNLKIDSVKVTSWDPNTNNYTTSQDSAREGEDVTIGTPRPYIVIDEEATGTTDITNSEIAYLGYEAGYGAGRTGLRYESGDGSILRGNDLHHLYFGLYSRDVGGLIVENNHVHDNIVYGLDPHTGTHDMTIRNNIVHDNGAIGIICSLDCYNILIEDNEVYNNTKMGIMFSKNMYDSIARNNIVTNEKRGIVVSESHSNEIYNNTVSESGSGIDIDKESFENVIYNNTIIGIPEPSAALDIENDMVLEDNTLYSNILITATGQQIISLDEIEDEQEEDEE